MFQHDLHLLTNPFVLVCIGNKDWWSEWLCTVRLETCLGLTDLSSELSVGCEDDTKVVSSAKDAASRLLTFLKCSLELNRPENKGLEKAISFLEPIKQSIDEAAVTKGGPISWADLIQIAGVCYTSSMSIS